MNKRQKLKQQEKTYEAKPSKHTSLTTFICVLGIIPNTSRLRKKALEHEYIKNGNIRRIW